MRYALGDERRFRRRDELEHQERGEGGQAKEAGADEQGAESGADAPAVGRLAGTGKGSHADRQSDADDELRQDDGDENLHRLAEEPARCWPEHGSETEGAHRHQQVDERGADDELHPEEQAGEDSDQSDDYGGEAHGQSRGGEPEPRQEVQRLVARGVEDGCRQGIGEIEEPGDHRGGEDHARHGERQLAHDLAHHHADVAVKQALQHPEERECQKQDRRQVSHGGEGRSRAGEPVGLHLRAGRRLEELQSSLHEEGRRVEDPLGDALGDLLEAPSGDATHRVAHDPAPGHVGTGGRRRGQSASTGGRDREARPPQQRPAPHDAVPRSTKPSRAAISWLAVAGAVLSLRIGAGPGTIVRAQIRQSSRSHTRSNVETVHSA